MSKMPIEFHVEIDRLDGTLIRILGLVERRGFVITSMNMHDLGEALAGLSVRVLPRDPSRRPETLGLQIDRLYGVRRLMERPAWAAP
jgi:acetolactate synthase II small subunit